MTIDQVDRTTLIMSLGSIVCPLCGKSKFRRKSFCLPDFMALPKDLRDATYLHVGRGYEEAIAAAFAHRGKTEFHLPRGAAGRDR